MVVSQDDEICRTFSKSRWENKAVHRGRASGTTGSVSKKRPSEQVFAETNSVAYSTF